MRSLLKAVVFFFVVLTLFAQTDRSTMTGTISDPAGAVVAKAAIEARNTGTGAVYRVASSATGNYTIAEPARGERTGSPSPCPDSRSPSGRA